MRVRQVWVRFYKSFNFDYELKATPGAVPQPWQQTEDGWMPHATYTYAAHPPPGRTSGSRPRA